MSDGFVSRFFSGNLAGPHGELERHQPKRRLVEECEIVAIGVVQQVFGKKALIAAVCGSRPFRLPVPGGFFDVWLIDESHRLPGRTERWSSLEDGTARLWFVCPACRRKTAKLYYFHVAPGFTSELKCRECHRLTYLCVNSGGNRWYREIGRPLKLLLRQKRKLLSQKRGRISAKLAQIDAEVHALREKMATVRRTLSAPSRQPSADRRRYRDFTLIDDVAAI
jgi:hypothetical protein